MEWQSELIETAMVAASAGILVVYYWRLARKTRRDAKTTAMGRHRLARAAWLASLRQGADPIVVVQMLRNWITAATFLASMAILFAVGFLGAAFTTEKLSQFAHNLNFMGVQDQEIWLLKALVLIVVYLAAFFCFSLSTRAFIHAGFAISAALKSEADGPGQIQARDLEQGARYYTLGMRCLYVSIPLALWLFGPLWMLLGALALVIILHFVD
jgi:uncharacterized membrane protein